MPDTLKIDVAAAAALSSCFFSLWKSGKLHTLAIPPPEEANYCLLQISSRNYVQKMSVGGDQQCAISSLLLKRSAYTHKDPSKSCNTYELAHAFTCGDKNRILNNSKQFMLQLLLCKSLWMHEIFCGGGGHWRESHPKICKFFFGLDFSFVDVVVLFILLRRKSQQQHIISCFHTQFEQNGVLLNAKP